MISWLQRTLQRHYKWLFSIMLVIIVIAFVFTIGASPGIGTGKKSAKAVNYYGYNLNDPSQVEDLALRTDLTLLMDTGVSGYGSSAYRQKLILTRPAILSLADDLQIPDPTDAEVVEYIKEKKFFKNETGKFDANKYQKFLSIMENDPKIDQDFVRETIAQNFRINQIFKTIMGPGFVLPYEAQVSLKAKNTEWSVDVATLTSEKLKKDVQTSDEELATYYKNNKHQYALPLKISVSYILFPYANFLSGIDTPNDRDLEIFFNENVNLFPKEAKYERKLALREYKKYQAKRLAESAANDFQLKLYEEDIPYNSPKINDIAKDLKGDIIKELEPYAQNNAPKIDFLPENLLKSAFNLTKDRYFSEIGEGKNSAVILLLKKKHPIEIPELSKIRNKVRQDYLGQKTLTLLGGKGKEIEKQLKLALNAGKSFKQAAQNEGLALESYNNFKIEKTPEGFDNLLLNEMVRLKDKQLSDLILRDKKLSFIYVTEKSTPDVESISEEADKFSKQMEPIAAAAASQGFVEELISKGLKNISTE